ncbi:hypothetical protein [Puia dinghuensis]|uniref:Uncharacterized protein n=1 Tax=Puia dinghuensis TaxID=1792502 RepID=A0A8J2UBJ6_9BACT|nr:hypothetical protein [Puia dinghuensis]GGA92576.1 hypothetical protein GCM10011511_14940 [Puia dinghuensis]
MTTSLKNVSFDAEVLSFDAAQPASPLKLSLALTDLLQANGPEFITSLQGQALLHSLMKASHGKDYKIDGKKEQLKLKKGLIRVNVKKILKSNV